MEAIKEIVKQAQDEVNQEKRRALVDIEKEKLKKKKWWHKILPFKIVITRRE